MAQHQLILCKHFNDAHPVRSLDGRLMSALKLVIHGEPPARAADAPGLCFVAPGDVLELVVAVDPREGACLWILESNSLVGGLCMELETGVRLVPVNDVIPWDQGEQRRGLWISSRNDEPTIPPDDTTGNAGTMVATPPLAPPDGPPDVS
jgi:hypothetical protein